METYDKGTGVIVVNSNGQILMIQRGDNKKWGLPGGKADEGEKLIHAAIRELYEETGLEIDQDNLEYLGKVPSVAKIKGVPNYVYSHEYICQYEHTRGDFKQAPGEVLDIKWVSMEELPDMDLFFPTAACLSHALESGLLW